MSAVRDRESLAVVGNGMASFKLCERLVEEGVLASHRVTVIGEEVRPAYDRVHLTDYFAHRDPTKLALASAEWYREQGLALELGDPVVALDPAGRTLRTRSGRLLAYDQLVLATGSAPFVPPLPGFDLPNVFVYRTIEDLEAIVAAGAGARTAAVVGGGLLGLEAARAVRDLGLAAHVVEFAPRLMARQLDEVGAALLRREIEAMGVTVHVSKETTRIERNGAGLRMCFACGNAVDVDLVVVSAGIRPRDELARAAGLEVGPRGGIVVDDEMRTSDPRIFAIGECAAHRGTVYGLVSPAYQMASTVAVGLAGRDARFTGADCSTRLKLMGVEVATIGASLANGATRYVSLLDEGAGIYRKLLIDPERQVLVGAILVGDASSYASLLHYYQSERALPPSPASLVSGGAAGDAPGAGALPDEALVCTCNHVTKGCIREAVHAGGVRTLDDLKSCTRAGTGCGGCVPQVKEILCDELQAAGVEVRKTVCEHFPLSRRDLFQIVKVKRLRSFDAVLEAAGEGDGCEVCKPAVASILASAWAESVTDLRVIQDTNDRFLANIQRGGTYSVIPRIPGGEITPDKLIALGEVAKRYDLYCKITGGQRIDLLGARLDQLPDIWGELVAKGFESGHAYAKALRTVKSCVGSTWCRYGVLDSTAFAIEVENRYRGLRAPHKIKSAVSGCIRECAEARSKDFGIIATEAGWDLYVCGNGGARPRHAELLASGLDNETCLRYVDRFLMLYIHTADPLTRTASWLGTFERGIDTLRELVVEDRLGLASQLEADMQALVGGYECEWAAVVNDPERRKAFRAFVNVASADPSVRFQRERGQKRPSSGGGETLHQPEYPVRATESVSHA